MALASLFAQSKDLLNSTDRRPVHALIVDHKVRQGSTEEAEWVAEQCRVKFGMKASVLPLTWPSNFDPFDHTRFETDARTLRYQALGRACREVGIRDLLVAHHADDQAETVFMRLANNRLRSGLQAMHPIEWIPECHGIHGVSHSGNATPFASRWPHSKIVHFELGGIRILRPLLSFDKSRLIATCEQHGVAWVEDKTNHLKTYTSRNAVRHILKNHKLPAALSIESLIDVSKHMQARVNSHKAWARTLLRRCSPELNHEVGSLHIQLPNLVDLLEENDQYSRHTRAALRDEPISCSKLHLPATWTQSDWHRARNTAICLLAEVSQMISPLEKPPVGELASTVAHIWPDFRTSDSLEPADSEGIQHKSNFCVHGIWWRKRDTSFSRDSTRPEWLLTRQPLLSHKSGVIPESIRYTSSHMFPLSQLSPGEPSNGQSNDWQLFDGRWWIYVRNHTADTLILRHFTKADLDRMPSLHRTARRGGPDRYIAVALSLLKPADIRFTLPALFRRDMATEKETLIGFPTLNVSMSSLGSPHDICFWNTRYKKQGNNLGDHGNVFTRSPTSIHSKIRSELMKFDKSQQKRPVSTNAGADERLSVFFADTLAGDQSTSPEPALERTSSVSIRQVPKQRTVPLVPTAESERHGRSEKRKGGGYDIKWEDFSRRVG